MNIIIIGCGKVGLTLAEQLCEEKHNVVLIDNNASKLQEISEELDALRIVGNGSSIHTQIEADVQNADLLIAVTGSDELNLLCCLIAKKAGKCYTIARVRNPIYSEEIGFIKESLGISMIINPELTASREIARLLQFPSAIQIGPFAKGRVELLKFKLRPEFGLDQMPIHRMHDKLKCDILVAGVERKEQVFIPNGDFVLQNGDQLSILASPKNAVHFFKTIGMKTNQVRSCMIIGGGKIAYYLAKQLLDMKISVRIIEKSKARCEELSELLPNALVLNGDGTNKKLLLEEGMERMEAFVTLTDMDEENILLALFAKAQTNAKLVTKVNRISFDNIIEQLDLGSVIYPKYLMTDYILKYVRAMNNTIGSNVETLYQILDNRAEALEFAIDEKSPLTGIPFMELKLKDNLLIGCINRKGMIIIPRGRDCMKVGDTIVVVTTHKGLHSIQDILAK
ncbi:MAG TPA: Trk system potassium transporter TrkA [Lachnospiraceae bacterium]|nr:Trk system potassium transporter TrkA [Lachnospiraceae bacterium]